VIIPYRAKSLWLDRSSLSRAKREAGALRYCVKTIYA
jgi:hypothetical protein